MSAQRPRTGPARIQPARRIAYEVLRAVHESDAYANLLLPAKLAEAQLSEADAGLATELSYGTLRRQGYYDRVLSLVTGRPLVKLDPEVLDALRLGAHQLLGMRVAAHAAVDESVALVAANGKRSATGFVNGVLRTLTRSTPEEWRERAMAGLAGDQLLASEESHPLWIVEAFREALDADGRSGELRDLLEADNLAPRVSLVALPGLSTPEQVGELGSVSPIAARSAGGDPASNPVVASGRARVQDEGSQLAALALSRARPIRAGESWLDLCSGPGGKAAVLAAEAAIGGATLLANEVIPARAQLVRNALAAFADPPEVVVNDGRAVASSGELFDRILLDAPCTGLGALRRRPEARWRKQPSDLEELGLLQAELLDAAVSVMAPDGLLAYVTCSPHRAETRDAIAGVLARHPTLVALDTPAVLAGIATHSLDLGPGLHAQLWPHRHGTDAMFIQLLIRPAAPL
ncbi:MAG: rRNA small subunit methyltransferase B [Acidobacteria bacterium]|nr:rRNA small subunit methyltransferase B [Acidobacteriota bacterium]